MHPSQWVTHGKLERFHLQAEDSIFLHGRNYRFFFRSSVSRLQVNKSAPLACVALRNGLPIFAPRHNFRRGRGEAVPRNLSCIAFLSFSKKIERKRKNPPIFRNLFFSLPDPISISLEREKDA